MTTELYYLAYGSNLDPERLGRHLAESTARQPQWTTIDHGVQFAGNSRRWHGGVAFLTLTPTGVLHPARLYPMTGTTFAALFGSENFVGELPPDPSLLGLQPGEWIRMLIPGGAADWRGKYNAILRLDDHADAPVYTFTTCRDLPPRPPGSEYLTLIANARSLSPTGQSPTWQGDPPQTPDPSTRRGDAWYGSLAPTDGRGVTLPAELAPTEPADRARVVDPMTGRSLEVELRFEGEQALIGQRDRPSGSDRLLILIDHPASS